MKTVMVIIDGLGDEPIEELGGRTPLEVSFIPNIHYIANRGQIGQIETTFQGFPIESMVCIMGLLGYDPERYYPNGRASFEALAKGIPLNSEDLILRCNCVTADLQNQTLVDFSAGLISDSDARALVAQIKLPFSNWELYPGQSYRNILIIRGAGIEASTLKCYEPHMNIGKPIKTILPRGENTNTERLASVLSDFLLDSQKQISKMDLPTTCAANMLWVWSPSKKPVWPSFKELTGLNAAFVGGLDFLHGIAMAAKIHYDVIPGATGYINTDYQAKANCALKYIPDYDFVLIHVNAADEEAHQHNYTGKIKAIEQVDRLIVGPILYELTHSLGNQFRIIICGDHATRCRDGKHTDMPVPYATYGCGIQASHSDAFSEKNSSACPLMKSLLFAKKILCNYRA